MPSEHPSREEYLNRVRERILACARSVLVREVEPLQGVRELTGLLSELGDPALEEARLALVGIDSQTDHLPLGSVRENWAAETLVDQDREIAEATDLLSTEIADACRELLNRLERAV